MNTAVQTPAFVMNLPRLFDAVGPDQFKQVLDTNQDAARFANAIREQHGEFVEVKQQFRNVIITIR